MTKKDITFSLTFKDRSLYWSVNQFNWICFFRTHIVWKLILLTKEIELIITIKTFFKLFLKMHGHVYELNTIATNWFKDDKITNETNWSVFE